ncbi:hypothetical protein WAI453_007017 [Rhynchosporium graminicola]|uniref:Uncharacterized protein n=1 Tax=Rhynchosporium graminicola TaxID=2792576 RepID=A0A1E1LGX4_9HELO|nr:uncharacterized protein RCO7_02161 [Rhynchosporium commune]
MSPSNTSKISQAKATIQKVAPAPTEGQTDGRGVSGAEMKGQGGEKGEGEGGKKTLRQIAMGKLDENPSQLGDPISLKAETSDSEPTDQDRGARGGSGKSKL